MKYYYDEKSDANTKKYLRYLKKLDFYLNGEDANGQHVNPPDIGLNDDEKDILREFCNVLSKQALSWLNDKWDLCPLLRRASSYNYNVLSPREVLSGTIGNKDEKFAELNDREVGSVDDMDESVGSAENDNVVEDNDANVADGIKFKVLFRYMGNDGRPAKHEEEVVQNQHLPRFHTHNKYEKDGSTFTFKHWLLESGNLTSSLTVLSDLVFVAVYDETQIVDTSDSET